MLCELYEFWWVFEAIVSLLTRKISMDFRTIAWQNWWNPINPIPRTNKAPSPPQQTRCSDVILWIYGRNTVRGKRLQISRWYNNSPFIRKPERIRIVAWKDVCTAREVNGGEEKNVFLCILRCCVANACSKAHLNRTKKHQQASKV